MIALIAADLRVSAAITVSILLTLVVRARMIFHFTSAIIAFTSENPDKIGHDPMSSTFQ